MQPAPCHPHRPVHAKSLCYVCYQKTRRPAPCHPERPIYAHDLCFGCYRKKHKEEWPSETAQAHRQYGAAYRARYRDRIRSRTREWWRTRPRDDALRIILRRQAVRHRYKTTPENIQTMLEQQGHVCAICGQNDRELVVDHCHRRIVFRGMLCRPCNMLLGCAFDNPAILVAAIEYLNRTSEMRSTPLTPRPPGRAAAS